MVPKSLHLEGVCVLALLGFGTDRAMLSGISLLRDSVGPYLHLWCRLWVTLVSRTSLVNAQSSHLVTVQWLCRERCYFITNRRRSHWWNISPRPTSVMKDNTHYSVIQSCDPWAGQEAKAGLTVGWFGLQAICRQGVLREKEMESPEPWLWDPDSATHFSKVFSLSLALLSSSTNDEVT